MLTVSHGGLRNEVSDGHINLAFRNGTKNKVCSKSHLGWDVNRVVYSTQKLRCSSTLIADRVKSIIAVLSMIPRTASHCQYRSVEPGVYFP